MKTVQEFWQDLVTTKSLLFSFLSANVVTMICSAFLSNTIVLLLLLQVLFVGFLILYSKALKGFTKIVTAIVMLVILVTLFVCNSKKPEEYADLPTQQETQQEEPQEEETQPEEKQEEKTDQTTVSKTSSYSKPKADPQKGGTLQVSYGGGENTSHDMTSNPQNDNDNDAGNTSDFTGEPTQPKDPIDTTGKDVVDENEGVDSVTDTATEEEKDEVNDTDGNTDADWSQMLPPKEEDTDKPQSDDEDPSEVEEEDPPKEDKPNDNNNDTQTPVDDNDKEEEGNTSLDTDKEEKPEESKPEESKPEEDKPQEEQNPSKDEEENDEDQIEEDLPKEDVKITSLSGDTAYAGDTVQFRISGDIKSVEGLEGLNYTLKNGCLTINTAKDEATVITPKVIGENGSTAMTSVTITVLNFE